MKLKEIAAPRDTVLTQVGINPNPGVDANKHNPDGKFSPLGTEQYRPTPLTANHAVKVDKRIKELKKLKEERVDEVLPALAALPAIVAGVGRVALGAVSGGARGVGGLARVATTMAPSVTSSVLRAGTSIASDELRSSGHNVAAKTVDIAGNMAAKKAKKDLEKRLEMDDREKEEAERNMERIKQDVEIEQHLTDQKAKMTEAYAAFKMTEAGVMPWLGDLGPQDDELADADKKRSKDTKDTKTVYKKPTSRFKKNSS